LKIIENIRRQAKERTGYQVEVADAEQHQTSPSFLHEDQQVIARRKQRAQMDIELKQKELLEISSVDGGGQSPMSYKNVNEHAVLSLESLNVAGSSVSSLAELIRMKEEEIRAKKSAHAARMNELAEKQRIAAETEMKIQQLKAIEYLRQLEEEEMMVQMEIENVEKVNAELVTKISHQTVVLERLESATSGPGMSIATSTSELSNIFTKHAPPMSPVKSPTPSGTPSPNIRTSQLRSPGLSDKTAGPLETLHVSTNLSRNGLESSHTSSSLSKSHLCVTNSPARESAVMYGSLSRRPSHASSRGSSYVSATDSSLEKGANVMISSPIIDSPTNQVVERRSTPEIFSIASPVRSPEQVGGDTRATYGSFYALDSRRHEHDERNGISQDSVNPEDYGYDITNISPVSCEQGGIAMLSLLPSPEIEMPVCDEISDLPDEILQTLGVGRLLIEPVMDSSEEMISLADSPQPGEVVPRESSRPIDENDLDISPMGSTSPCLASKLSISGLESSAEDVAIARVSIPDEEVSIGSPIHSIETGRGQMPAGCIVKLQSVPTDYEFTLSTAEDRPVISNMVVEEVKTAASSVEIEDASTTSDIGDEIVDRILSTLMDSVLAESLAQSTHPARRIPSRIDSFDIAGTCAESSGMGGAIDTDLVIKILMNFITEHIWLGTDDEISDSVISRLKNLEFENTLLSIPGLVPSIAACIADSFIVLLDSLPPAMVADREWQIRFPNSRNPLTSFLPQRHTLGTVMKGLRGLIDGYNMADGSSVEEVLCQEYVKKMKCDEILFQCNDSGLWTQFGSESMVSRAESEIVDEVSMFVLEAVLTSVANDFETAVA
jgi:hypothetical protein